MATSTSTHTTNSAEYERKNSPSTLMESITKQAENARKYERIFEYGFRCLTGYKKGNSEADTTKGKVRGQRLVMSKGGKKVSYQEQPIRGFGSRGIILFSTVSCTRNSQ